MNLNTLLPFLSVAILICAGCSSVKTTHPLPRSPTPVDQEAFEGAWLFEDQVFHVRFASNGVARIASVEWKNNQFRFVTGEMTVTKGKAHNFLSVRFQEEGIWEADYFFVAYRFTDQGDLILWVPHGDAFEALIEKKKLLGIVKKEQYSTSITITNTAASLLEMINDPENMGLFDYREPIVLRKLSEERNQTGRAVPADGRTHRKREIGVSVVGQSNMEDT